MKRNLKDVFEEINDKKLLLPDFQRDYKWTQDKQRSLLASTLLSFPIGSSLLLTGNSNDFAARAIGETGQLDIKDGYDCEFLLDGQQRTTTLFNAFTDIFKYSNFSNEKEFVDFVSRKASPLKRRWFLRIPLASGPNAEATDFFNARQLKFDKESLEQFEPDDILSIFQQESFDEKNRKMSTKWFSPFHQLSKKTGSSPKDERKITSEFVDECVSKGLIPLFYLEQASMQIIKRILKKIADNNAQSIIDEHSDDFEFIKRNYDSQSSLDDYSSIQEINEDGDDLYEQLISDIFNDVKNDWCNAVVTYLRKDIFELYEFYFISTSDIRRAIPIFCHLNEGGLPLDDFDLVAAKTAKKQPSDSAPYSLLNVVRDIFAGGIELGPSMSKRLEPLDISTFKFTNLDLIDDGLPRGYLSKTILSVCSMIISSGNNQEFVIKKEHTSSKTLLKQDIVLIREAIPRACIGVARAIAFLSIRCGINNASKLHYKLMIEPIAYALTNDKFWNSGVHLNKLEFWYWSSLFSGGYAYNQSAQVIEDINRVVQFLFDDTLSTEPSNYIQELKSKVLNKEDFATKDLLLHKADTYPGESIRVAILQFILSKSPFDMLKSETKKLRSYDIRDGACELVSKSTTQLALHDHHIIPLGAAKGLGQKTDEFRKDASFLLNSPLNRVYISADANQVISSLPPKQYFDDLAENNHVLESLMIPTNLKMIEFDDLASEDSEKLEALLKSRFEILENSLDKTLLNLQHSFKA